MTQKSKIILDTDPGIDDILAIVLAYASPEFELLGVTTVAGNCSVEDGTRHALVVREVLSAQQSFPISMGCARPLTRPLRTQKDIFGHEEDLPTPLNPRWREEIDPQHAVNFLINTILSSPGEVILFPLAPLTNIATAIIMQPAFAPAVKEIYLMGGAARVPGNTFPTTEFNFWVDPEAAKIVFESGIPITMIGLDVTGKTALFPEDAARLDALNTPVTRFIRQITRHYLDANRPCYLYDPLAVAVGLMPSIVMSAPETAVMIETQGEFTAGTSVCDFKGRLHQQPNARVCLEVDSDAFLDLFWQRVVMYHPPNR
jgi:purine nucleosidase